MPDLQQHPSNLNLIKNVEDNIVHLNRIVFISVNLFIASYKKKRASHFSRETVNEVKQFK